MTRRPAAHRPTASRAFTLVEAIATIVVIATVSLVASRVISSSTQSYTQVATRSELHAQAASAMDQIVQNLRQARVRPASSPVAPDITGVTPTSVSWVMPDGTAITVARSGSTLQAQYNAGAWVVLATNVTAFNVQCFDESSAALATTLSGSALDPIRRIEITLGVSLSGVTETLRTRVFLRAMVAGASSS
jgi:type II secretory pathway pseudopilin PulG